MDFMKCYFFKLKKRCNPTMMQVEQWGDAYDLRSFYYDFLQKCASFTH
jgi:hypothetical protein